MSRILGINTRAVAEKLTKMIEADGKRYKGIKVYYDHGDSSNPQVRQPTTFMGKRYGNDATLSGVDIVALKEDKVIAAVEIEESKVRPKTILGDIFGIVLASGLSIHSKRYKLRDTAVNVAVADDGIGKRSLKYKRLQRLLNRYFAKNPPEAVKKVIIVTTSTNDLVRRIERLIRLEIGKHL